MLVFQVGDDRGQRDQVDGLAISLDRYRQQPDAVAELLVKAGFDVRVRVVGAGSWCGEGPAGLSAGRQAGQHRVAAWPVRRAHGPVRSPEA